MLNRQLVIWGPRKLSLIESEVPELGNSEVLVRVRASAICTWEQRTFKGDQTDSYPLLGGHELSGEVLALGPGVKERIQVGGKVAVARLTRCGECYNCRTGKDNICLNARSDKVAGHPFGPGGLSEYIVAPAYQIYPFQNDPSFEVAALSEPLSCVVRSVRKAGVDFGQNVVIMGGGVMGILHTILTVKRGAMVLVSEPLPHRREKALEYGAKVVVNPLEEDVVSLTRKLTRGVGADAVFVTGGGAKAVEQAIDICAKGGTVIIYGAMYPSPKVTIDTNRIHHNEITITGSMSQTKEDFLLATRLIDSGAIDLNPLISATVPFVGIEEAFEKAIDPSNYRIVVTMP
ncbi:MAG: alcohol dehydrogenase catalytic domain-containing protein [Firmicutes bacterium]|nr:alcohol dehydrogenase catalytic domain-containing protein [Bacillota bacterium]MCL5040490.1 alcohol dehydrogenase catalytic domain-containing protein [Bacillota bacterium]